MKPRSRPRSVYGEAQIMARIVMKVRAIMDYLIWGTYLVLFALDTWR